MLKSLAALSAAIVAAAAPAPAKGGPQGQGLLAGYAAPQQRIAVGSGRVINLVCTGQGAPTVILSAGGAAWSFTWWRVQPVVARKTRVCAWDRAGSGFSGASPDPQDIAHTELDLERALDEAAVTGPLVLVGHSRGALESLLFADRRRERVVGMVLIDPAYPDQAGRLRAAAPAAMTFSARGDARFQARISDCIAALKAARRDAQPPADCLALRTEPGSIRQALMRMDADPAYWESYLSGFQLSDHNAVLAIDPRRDFGDMPLAVLSAGIVNLAGAPAEAQRELPALKAELERGKRGLAALSSRGRFIPIPDAGHAIHLQNPVAVINAIERVLAQVGSDGATAPPTD